MRVTTAFNRLLQLDGASVSAIAFTNDGVEVSLRRRARLHRCPCGARTPARYDTSHRRWRHLDLGRVKVWLRAEVARVDCRVCGRIRTEEVPWARPGARHSRDFEDMVCWLAQRMDKTAVTRLLRCSWSAVAAIVARVVEENIDDSRLDDLFAIGVDEISYKRGHRYLTVVTDHVSGNVIWVGQGAGRSTLEAFYDELGERARQLQAVTMDGSNAFIAATRAKAPDALICFDPFHVISWANQALDRVFRDSKIPTVTAQMKTAKNNAPWRKARYTVLAGRQRLTTQHQQLLRTIRSERVDLYRAWLAKEELRDLFSIIDPDQAEAYLYAWARRTTALALAPMTALVRKVLNHLDGILATVRLGLSNGRSEGINTKIRVIQRRGYGHPNPVSLAAMIYLCCSGLPIALPTQT